MPSARPLPSFLYIGSETSNTSPGATKRGASGIETTFGVTFVCTDAAPDAESLHATTVTRTSPTNSGSCAFHSPFPSAPTASGALHIASGLKRRVGTGLTRPSISAPAPPPVFTPLARSWSVPRTGRTRW